jgi:hypothetical protein
MEKKPLEFNYWDALDKYIKETYPTKVCLLYDTETSFFDIDDVVPEKPVTYIFDTVEEFQEWYELDERDFCNIVNDMAVLWVNGERAQSIIYELRG